MISRSLWNALVLAVLVAGLGGCTSGGESTKGQPEAGDTAAPSVAITGPSSSGSFETDQDSIGLSGTASDNVGVDNVGWVNDRGGEGTATGTDNWSVTAIALQSGDNRITVTASDAAGNSATDVLTVTYTPPDVMPPSVMITSPSPDPAYTTASSTISIGGTAGDDVGIDHVTWRLNGGSASNAVGTDNWTTPVIALNAGLNTITVTAYDAAGNTATDEIDITFDAGTPAVLKGIAIIGDSNSDEYRADDNRGGAYAATTFNWMEQLVRYRGLNFGAWGTRPSPRRTGYAYNWALSGATAASAISGGQHTGVAQQIAAGNVSLVFINIGWNDFAREKYAEIYSGTLSGSALDDKINGVIDNITTAVDTVLAAGPVGVVLTDLFDYSIDQPALVAAFPDPARRQAVTDAIRRVNSGLATLAQQRGIVLVDTTAYATNLYGSADQNGFIDVGGELIDTVNPGDEPHHLALGDSVGHAGTIGNAIAANGLFIDPVNNAFGTTIVPFSEQEMLSIAGISTP